MRHLARARVARTLAGALVLGLGGVAGLSSARAADFYGEDYDAPPVVTRRVVVERPIYLRPAPVVREVVVERPVYVHPRPVVREVVVERPVVYRPRPFVREVVVEPYDRPYGPRRFGYGY